MELIEFQLPFDDLDPVAKDVRDGLLSLQKAREVYGVVVNPETVEVDSVETDRLRAMRSAAGNS